MILQRWKENIRLFVIFISILVTAPSPSYILSWTDVIVVQSAVMTHYSLHYLIARSLSLSVTSVVGSVTWDRALFFEDFANASFWIAWHSTVINITPWQIQKCILSVLIEWCFWFLLYFVSFCFQQEFRQRWFRLISHGDVWSRTAPPYFGRPHSLLKV